MSTIKGTHSDTLTTVMTAAAVNSSKFSQATRCAQIFDEFKPYHTSSGEIKVNLYFSKIQERGKEGLAFHFEKGKVLIVCYSTTFSTTHAVCWDIERKRILDSEYRNNEVFTYPTSFDNDCLSSSK